MTILSQMCIPYRTDYANEPRVDGRTGHSSIALADQGDQTIGVLSIGGKPRLEMSIIHYLGSPNHGLLMRYTLVWCISGVSHLLEVNQLPQKSYT